MIKTSIYKTRNNEKTSFYFSSSSLYFSALFAQQNDFTYIDFEPDLSSTTSQDSLWLDFDCNGSGDICLYMTPHFAGGYMAMINASNQWELCTLQGNEADSLPIPDILESWKNEYGWFMNQDKERFVVRKRCENNKYQYGWFRAYWYPTWNPYICHLNLDKFAFCTIPDYPLKWGQTSFTGIEENNEFSAFATLHPNPTSGLVTIMGENLKQAEACNMLGQQVLSVQGKAMNFTSTWLNCPQASISSPSPMRKVGNVYVR